MRAKLLTILFLIFIIVPYSRAQEAGFPACSWAELTYSRYTVVPDFLDLLETVSLEMETAELAQVGETYLQWRRDILPSLLTCVENIRLGLLMSQMGADTVSALGLYFARFPRDRNHYATHSVADIEAFSVFIDEVSDLIESGERNDLSPSQPDDLPICKQDEVAALLDLAREFQAVHEERQTIEIAGDLPPYIEKQLDWRVKALANMPECAEALKWVVHMLLLNVDTGGFFALQAAGISNDANPFVQPVANGGGLVEQWLATNLPVQGVAPGLRPYGSNFPGCSLVQAYFPIGDGDFRTILEKAQSSDTLEALQTFGSAQISWRADLWKRLAQCAEALEIGWFMSQLAGDLSAAAAFQLAGLEAADNVYRERALLGLDENEALESLLDQPDWADGLASEAGEVSVCDARQAAQLENINADFQTELVGAALKIESLADLIRYSEIHIEWRDGIWRELPGCEDALVEGLLMNVIATDFATAFALKVAGVDTDNNPYMLQALGAWTRLLDRTILADLLESEPTETKTYYVTANPAANIRSCASTNCRIVGSAKRGEAITVIDDSADWYEIRLENGETAFIAGFLASKDRPGN
ncbi:MAG: SH3 domain-containing protein [Chloroflexi bacterium]|nr:SH3 domain-containing protein [Chloroflexota bacterium]